MLARNLNAQLTPRVCRLISAEIVEIQEATLRLGK